MLQQNRQSRSENIGLPAFIGTRRTVGLCLWEYMFLDVFLSLDSVQAETVCLALHGAILERELSFSYGRAVRPVCLEYGLSNCYPAADASDERT